uniref:T6PP_N domain-containing protein n=1 Tax=Heterorhabditis bacteriophora TaxID=37862 RepID=A0A1I7X5Q4_HETBA
MTETEKAQCVEAFKHSLYDMQNVRRQIVSGILKDCSLESTLVDSLQHALAELTDSRTSGEMRHISTPSANFPINIRDEIRGLRKDVEFLRRLSSCLQSATGSIEGVLEEIDIASILAPFHPNGPETFGTELENAERFLMDFVDSSYSSGQKPLFVTDWDGTMKDYCSQYATNLQVTVRGAVSGGYGDDALFTRMAFPMKVSTLLGDSVMRFCTICTSWKRSSKKILFLLYFMCILLLYFNNFFYLYTRYRVLSSKIELD